MKRREREAWERREREEGREGGERRQGKTGGAWGLVGLSRTSCKSRKEAWRSAKTMGDTRLESPGTRASFSDGRRALHLTGKRSQALEARLRVTARGKRPGT